MYEDHLKQYGFVPFNHDKPQWFDVRLDAVFDAKGREVPGYCRVERDDTGDTLAVHSDKYKLIPYREFFDDFDRAMQESGLDLTDMHVGTDLADNGAKVYRQYILPAYVEEIRPGEQIALRLAMFNSYDATMAARGLAGFYSFACANQAFIGRSVIDLRVRHVGNVGHAQIIEKLITAAGEHVGHMQELRLWDTVQLMAADVKAIVEAMPQATEALTDNFVSRWATGNNHTLWDLHNLLTNWATHGTSGVKTNRARVSHDRHQRVLQLTNGKVWEKFAQTEVK